MNQKAEDDPKDGKPWPLIFAALLSVTWFVILLFLLGLSNKGSCVGGAWYQLYVSCLAPNEVGDLLAGAFAPVAFFWVAAAVFIQAQELKAQRSELRASRKAATAQAKTAGEQLNTLLEEKHERERMATDNAVFEALKTILFNMTNRPLELGLRFYQAEGRSGFGGYSLLNAAQQRRDLSPEQLWQAIADNLSGAITAAKSGQYSLEENDRAVKLADVLDKLLNNRDNMSDAGRVRLDGLPIPDIAAFLRFWGNGFTVLAEPQ